MSPFNISKVLIPIKGIVILKTYDISNYKQIKLIMLSV